MITEEPPVPRWHSHTHGRCNMPHLHNPPAKLRVYPLHYCGHKHNPRYACPVEEPVFGGVPASKIPPCTCTGQEHDPDCHRRAAIAGLIHRSVC